MKTIEYNFKIPTFLLYAIEYGNEGTQDFTPEDTKTLEFVNDTALKLMKENNGEHYTWQYGEEEYFTWSPDFINLGCEVVDAILTIFIKE